MIRQRYCVPKQRSLDARTHSAAQGMTIIKWGWEERRVKKGWRREREQKRDDKEMTRDDNKCGRNFLLQSGLKCGIKVQFNQIINIWIEKKSKKTKDYGV